MYEHHIIFKSNIWPVSGMVIQYSVIELFSKYKSEWSTSFALPTYSKAFYNHQNEFATQQLGLSSPMPNYPCQYLLG